MRRIRFTSQGKKLPFEVIIRPLRGGFWPFQGALIIVLSDYSFETA